MGSQQRARFSRLRQRLRLLAEEVGQLVGPFMSSAPVVPGSVYELKRKCGKAGCRCASGHLHNRWVVSTKEGGKTKLRVIGRGHLVEVRQKAARYQRLRRGRMRLGQVYHQMLRVMDEMEAMRREEVHRWTSSCTSATKGSCSAD